MSNDWVILNISIDDIKVVDRSMRFREIPGLTILTNAISPAEESDIVASIDAAEWTSINGGREVQQYGWIYDYQLRNISNDYVAIPEWLTQIADRLGLPAPDNVIVNKYEPGEGIAQHKDHACFGPLIGCLSLLSPVNFDFKKEDIEHTVRLHPRTFIKMEDAARDQWTHGIAARKSDLVGGVRVPRQKRYSITFRTLN